MGTPKRLPMPSFLPFKYQIHHFYMPSSSLHDRNKSNISPTFCCPFIDNFFVFLSFISIAGKSPTGQIDIDVFIFIDIHAKFPPFPQCATLGTVTNASIPRSVTPSLLYCIYSGVPAPILCLFQLLQQIMFSIVDSFSHLGLPPFLII